MRRMMQLLSAAALACATQSVAVGEPAFEILQPQIAFDPDGATGYHARIERLTITAQPLRVQFEAGLPPCVVVSTDRMPAQMWLAFGVDENGVFIGGVSGPDLLVIGAVDEDGDGTLDHEGALLMGEVIGFAHRDGSEDPDEVASFDVRIRMTGGSLEPSFGPLDFGVIITCEALGEGFADDAAGPAECFAGGVRPVGACCLLGGACAEGLTAIECLIAGGEYQGRDSQCADVTCIPRGACCFRTSECTDRLTPTECDAADGAYQGDGSVCEFLRCRRVGACCYIDGTCIDFCSEFQCGLTGGTFQGPAILCSEVDCETGACCLPNGACVDGVDEMQCVVAGGFYQGIGTDCGGVDCDDLGACCFLSGQCGDDFTEDECGLAGGDYQGNGTDCANVVCIPRGACCLDSGDCIDASTRDDCEAAGGDYRGDGSECGLVVCAPVGACCLPDGSCVDGTTESECEMAGGLYQGDGSGCPTQCRPFGACCFADGACEDQTIETECVNAGGIYQGDGSSCLIACVPFGACCLTDGSCVDGQTASECGASGGVYQGDASECSDLTCPLAGACCFADGSCEDLSEDACLAGGGDFFPGDCMIVQCPTTGGEGCGHGYWKQSQHFDSWTLPYTPDTLFSDVFEDAFPGSTLLDVLELMGGMLNALGRETVAALLNAASPEISYDLTVDEVIDMFNMTYPNGNIEGLKDFFEMFNTQGCPID